MHAIEQSIARRLYAESWLIVWSSFWLAVVFVGIVAVLVSGWPWLVWIALPIFLVSQGIAIALAFRFRCPASHARLLVQGLRTLHPARKLLLPRHRSPSRVHLRALRREMQRQGLTIR